ncbi:MAG: hypothetical protein AAFX94_24480, partial [Myxococcota bacterium]
MLRQLGNGGRVARRGVRSPADLPLSGRGGVRSPAQRELEGAGGVRSPAQQALEGFGGRSITCTTATKRLREWIGRLGVGEARTLAQVMGSSVSVLGVGGGVGAGGSVGAVGS